MSKRTFFALWMLAGLAALVLLVATIGLAVRARAQAENETIVFLAGKSRLIHLREEPDPMARIVVMLDRGKAVAVTDSAVEGGRTWYQVETESSSGWVLAEYVSLNPP